MAVKFKWNMRDFRDLRTTPRMQNDLLARAQRVADACNAGQNKGYVAVQSGSGNRARTAVLAASPWARRDDAKHDTILKNLGAGQ